MTDRASSPPAPVELRLLTYNVRQLRAGTGAVARVIASARADVVCLQEVPSRFRWRSRAAELARRSGLYVVTGGRPAAGNLMLCAARVDVVTAGSHLLTRTPRLAARGCTAAVLRVGGVVIGVIGAHFGLLASERGRHAAEVSAIAAHLRARGATTVILAADLNARSGAREWESLPSGLRDTVPPSALWSTYPAKAPTARIDAVLAGPEVDGRPLRPSGSCRGRSCERPSSGAGRPAGPGRG